MNLIHDAWIPAVRRDGTREYIAPWQIGTDSNPVTDLSAPRADFQGALHEFLIGLLQTAFAPQDEEEWEERWHQPPSGKELAAEFGRLAEAFELDNENGPAFLQDYELPDDAESWPIRKLLIDYAGSPEVFVKPESVTGLCDRCAAAALHTWQTFGPAFGRGHRTGLRGAGPLTTLLRVGGSDRHALWQDLWLNVLERSQVQASGAELSPRVFPWLGPTRISPNGEVVNPGDVDGLHAYWAMPARIRIAGRAQTGSCSLCGANGSVWQQIRTRPSGTNYSSTWQHPLSPYRVATSKDDDATRILLSTKGKRGSFTYTNWLALTIGAAMNSEAPESAAAPVQLFNNKRRFHLSKPEEVVVWCFGYHMTNAKAHCWYEHQWPLAQVDADKIDAFVQNAETLSDAAVAVAGLLPKWVGAAWADTSPGDMSFVARAFYRESERDFLRTVTGMRSAVTSLGEGTSSNEVLADWRITLWRWAKTLFDRYALAGPPESLDMERVARALDGLERQFFGNKLIRQLKEGR